MAETDRQTTGILLLNLGGPDSLNAVRPFLYNLFSDREIIRIGPAFLQKPIAMLISTLRSKKTENMYRQIGGKSPILDITMAQAKALEHMLNQRAGAYGNTPVPAAAKSFKVYVGMRYWHPFIGDTLRKIASDGIRQLIVLTLYPHYSKATTGSSIRDFERALNKSEIRNPKFEIKYIDRWYDFPPYIEALSDLVAEGLSEYNSADRGSLAFLYSAHSLPESFITEGDPYLDHIKSTIELVDKRISAAPYNLTGLRSHLSFQSKTGPVKWLEPSTEEMILKFANEGRKNIFIVPVSFVSDHIETLYELDILYKDLAAKHGITLKRCKALNTSEKFIQAIKELVMSNLQEST